MELGRLAWCLARRALDNGFAFWVSYWCHFGAFFAFQ